MFRGNSIAEALNENKLIPLRDESQIGLGKTVQFGLA